MKHATRKLREWLWRYGPAEVVSLLATLVASLLVFNATADKTATALAGTWGGNIGYFGTILIWDVFHTRKRLHELSRTYSLTVFGKNIRALFLEFGVAEVFDTLLIRPVLLYIMPVLLHNLMWGLIAGKFLADISFYLPAILFYEWGKKRYRNF